MLRIQFLFHVQPGTAQEFLCFSREMLPGAIDTFLSEHEDLLDHGIFPLSFLEKNMGFYVFQLSTIGDISHTSN